VSRTLSVCLVTSSTDQATFGLQYIASPCVDSVDSTALSPTYDNPQHHNITKHQSTARTIKHTTTMLRTFTPALALLLATALCRAQSTFTCPAEGKFPDPESCYNYITCVPDGDSLEATVETCSLGLQWNDDKKVCDFEDESTCEIAD